MPHRLHNPLSRPSAGAAWLFAALLLWMGTGGVLHHTDDSPNLAPGSARAALGHVTPATADHDCAACQWPQGIQSGTISVCHLVLPLSFTLPCSRRVSSQVINRPSRLRSPRAPPAPLS